MQLVCLNKLSRSPDAYIRHGRSKFVLKLKFDKHTLVRTKGKGVNSYTINGKKLEFDRVTGKGKVPKQVEELLNVGRENFQRQLDSHFWFSDTPGQVSRHLNEMVNLGLIDKSLTHLASEVKKAKGDLELKSETLRDSKSSLQELAWVPEMDFELRSLEALKANRDKASQNALELESQITVMQAALMQRNALKRAVGAGKVACAAGKRLKEAKARIDELKEQLKRMEEAQRFLKVVIPDIRPLQEFRKKADAIAERWRILDYLVRDLNQMEEELWTIRGELEVKTARLKKLAKNRRCPKCNQLWKQSSSETCISHSNHQSAEERKAGSGKK